MLSAYVLRSIARGVPRRYPSLSTPHTYRILTARGFASTSAIFKNEPFGVKKGFTTVPGNEGALPAAAAAKTPSAKIEPKASLLAEAELTTKEQRKADWGIIKEMSRYLWPKVGGFSLQFI